MITAAGYGRQLDDPAVGLADGEVAVARFGYPQGGPVHLVF